MLDTTGHTDIVRIICWSRSSEQLSAEILQGSRASHHTALLLKVWQCVERTSKVAVTWDYVFLVYTLLHVMDVLFPPQVNTPHLFLSRSA